MLIAVTCVSFKHHEQHKTLEMLTKKIDLEYKHGNKRKKKQDLWQHRVYT